MPAESGAHAVVYSRRDEHKLNRQLHHREYLPLLSLSKSRMPLRWHGVNKRRLLVTAGLTKERARLLESRNSR